MNHPAPEVHEALAEVPVQQRAVDAIRQHEWEPEVSSRGWTRHDQHNFHAFCEVCSGNVEAMVKVLADAGLLADNFAEAVTEARADGETEWGVRYQNLDDEPVYIARGGEASARAALVGVHVLVRRTVTPWARADSLAPEAPSEVER